MNRMKKAKRSVISIILVIVLSANLAIGAFAFTENTLISNDVSGANYVFESSKSCAQLFSATSDAFLYSVYMKIANYTGKSTVTATIRNVTKNGNGEYIPGDTVIATADNTISLTGSLNELQDCVFYFSNSPIFLANGARYAVCFSTDQGAMYCSGNADTYAGGYMCWREDGDWIAATFEDFAFKICSYTAESSSEAAAYAAKLIASLPDKASITLADVAQISAVRTYYDSLSADTQSAVGDITRLTDAEEAITALNAAFACDVINLIDALPDATAITLDDTDAVAAARTAYDALTDAQKLLVTNYDKLTADEAAITNINQTAADVVIKMIDALPAVITLDDVDAVNSTYAAYEALTDTQKQLVTNYGVLTSAMSSLSELYNSPAYIIYLIDKLPVKITLADRGQIVDIRYKYNCLSDDDKALITNIDGLISAETALLALEEPYLLASSEVIGTIAFITPDAPVAQTFTAAKSGVLTNVSAAFGIMGNTALKASICALTEAGLPGEVLAESNTITLQVSDKVQTANFDFSGSGFEVTEGTQYALLIQGDGFVIAFVAEENPYSGGYFCHFTESGSWAAETSADLYFVCLTGSNTAPVAKDVNVSTNEGTSVAVDLSGFISDADGDALTISVDSAVNGSAVLSGTTVTFTPASDAGYSASFVYTVSDGKGGTDTATVYVTIKVPTSITVSGPASVTVPLRRVETLQYSFTAAVYDQNATEMIGRGVTWSLAAPVTGVSINPSTGVLTVTYKAPVGRKIGIKAVSGSVSETYTIYLGKYVSVSSVTLSTHSVTLAAGETKKLTATVSPSDATNQGILWYSTNTDVVKVDENGNLTAVKAGLAIVAAYSSDNGRLDLCIVCVLRAKVNVTGVDLSLSSATLNRGGTLWLAAFVRPLNATNKNVIWSSSNTNVLKVNAYGKVTAVGKGTATITVTTEDGGHLATCNIIVK